MIYFAGNAETNCEPGGRLGLEKEKISLKKLMLEIIQNNFLVAIKKYFEIRNYFEYFFECKSIKEKYFLGKRSLRYIVKI